MLIAEHGKATLPDDKALETVRSQGLFSVRMPMQSAYAAAPAARDAAAAGAARSNPTRSQTAATSGDRFIV